MGVLIKFFSKILLAVLVAVFIFSYAFNRWIEPDPTGTPQTLESTGLFISVDGIQYRYLDAGTGTATYVLLHGRGNNADTWRFMSQELAKSARVIAIDFAGYGYSAKGDAIDYSLEARVTRLHNVLDALNVHNVKIIGHELGAEVALGFAQTYPDRTEQLILISPSTLQHASTPSVFFKIPQISKAAMKLANSGKRLATIYEKQFADPSILTDEDVLLYTTPYSMTGTFDALLEMHALNDSNPFDYTVMTTPTLILWGNKDRVVTRADADHLAADMFDATFVPLEDVGHFAQEEAPNLVLIEVQDFISSLQ